MKLVYLYVESYKCLTDVDFRFDFRYSVVRQGKEIKIQKIFGEAGAQFFKLSAAQEGYVECLSAIVGDNGSGKTTAAKFLRDLFVGDLSAGTFVAIFVRDDCVDECEVLLGGGCSVESPNLHVVRFTELSDLMRFENNKNVGMRLFYYSPVYSVINPFQPTQKLFSGDVEGAGSRFVDISMNGVIEDLSMDRGSSGCTQVEMVIHEKKSMLEFFDAVSVNFDDEILARIFARVKEGGIVLALNDKRRVNALEGLKREAEYEYNAFPDDQLDLLSTLTSIDCRDNVTLMVFLDYAIPRLVTTSAVSSLPYARGGLDAELYALCQWLSSLDNDVTNIEDDLVERVHELGGIDDEMYGFSDLLQTISMFASKYKIGEGLEWRIKLGDGNRELLQQYIQVMGAYERFGSRHNLMAFEFASPPSAGEMAYLVLWSRLYTKIKEGCPEQSVMIFLDEVETSMHPSWQRKLVDRMIRFIEGYGGGHRVQVVFASHSPVLLSDLPYGCVTFLQSTSGATHIEYRKDPFLNTFGANIFDLYGVFFSLRSGTTGDFAQEKIDGVVKRVKRIMDGKKEVFDKADRLVVSLIGERYVRRYLEDYLAYFTPELQNA